MRFKNKLFLTTISLFFIAFFVSNFLISVFAYNNMIEYAQIQALHQHSVIASSVSRDLQALLQRSNKSDVAVRSLFFSYAKTLEKQHSYLQFRQNNIELYSSMPFEPDLSQELLAEEILVAIVDIDDEKYITVSSSLNKPFENYTLVYANNLFILMSSYKSLIQSLSMIYLISMTLFTLALYIIITKITKPIVSLKNATNRISRGDFSERIYIKGGDEFSELSEHFNNMTCQIQSKVDELGYFAHQKQLLVNNVAHELKTPLTSIYGYADYLKLAKIDEDERDECIEFIQSQCNRLKELSNKLLDIACIENQTLEIKKIDVSNIFKNVEKSLLSDIAAKNIHISYNFNIESILGDYVLIFSLMENIVKNSINASSVNGEIIINAYENHQKIIEIIDNGCGVETGDIKLLTEPFYRTDPSRSRNNGGTGLGLALCKSIVDAHGANMEIESNPLGGLIVRISFASPLQDDNNSITSIL